MGLLPARLPLGLLVPRLSLAPVLAPVLALAPAALC
jgi:hypothetical protein